LRTDQLARRVQTQLGHQRLVGDDLPRLHAAADDDGCTPAQGAR